MVCKSFQVDLCILNRKEIVHPIDNDCHLVNKRVIVNHRHLISEKCHHCRNIVFVQDVAFLIHYTVEHEFFRGTISVLFRIENVEFLISTWYCKRLGMAALEWTGIAAGDENGWLFGSGNGYQCPECRNMYAGVGLLT